MRTLVACGLLLGGCPTDAPDREEVCDNGSDDDGDGLADCEDGDCFEFADCEGADCLTLDCHPDGVRVEVTGGQLSTSWIHIDTWASACGPDAAYSGSAGHYAVTLTDVTGVVRVLGPGANGWTDATSTITCGWRYASGFAGREFDTRPEDSVEWGPTREGFAVDPGCRLSGSDFLPSQLVRAGVGEVRAGDGTLWFRGAVGNAASAYTDTYTTSFSWWSCSASQTEPVWGGSTWMETRWQGAFASGETYTP